MKQLTMRTKLISGFGIILLFLVVLGVLSISRFINVREQNNRMIQETENRIFAIAKEVDHLQGLSELFINDNVHSVSVETDPTKCSLGQWMHGGELETLAAINPQLAQLVTDLNGPHDRLHASAQEIDNTYAYYDSMVYEQLNSGWIAHLVWTKALSDSVIRGAPFHGALDYRQCSFGQWYYRTSISDPQLTSLLTEWNNPISTFIMLHNRLFPP